MPETRETLDLRWRFDRDAVVAETDPVGLTQELVRIPTHEADDPGIAFLARRFDRSGIAYEIHDWEHGHLNLVARVGEGRPSIVLNSHVDTVPPGEAAGWRDATPYAGELRDGCVWGRGAVDDKGCLAAMVAAFEMLHARRDGLAGEVILHAVGREEHGGIGTRTEIKRGLAVDAAIVGEATGLIPMIAHKGCWRLNLTTAGKPVHASRPRLGVNAIEKMADLIHALTRLAEQVERQSHPLVGSASLAVTMIEGGTALNVIPGACRIALERRLLPGEDEDQALGQIRQVIDELAKADGAFACDIEVVRLLRAAETHSPELVRLAQAVASDVLGRPVDAQGFTASCDMTFLVNEARIPTFIYGPGDLRWAHQFDERVPAEQVIDAARFYIAMCGTWAGSGGRKSEVRQKSEVRSRNSEVGLHEG